MKYKITLRNGAVVICDSYQLLKHGIAYINGTLEVFMTEDLFFKDSIKEIIK